MTTTTNVNPSPTQAIAPPPSLKQAWKWATTPDASLKGEDWRQARLLLGMLSVIIPLLIFAFVFEIIRESLAPQPYWGAVLLAGAALGLMVTAYVLGRTRYYRVGVWVFVLSPTLSVLLEMAMFPPEGPNTFILYYMVMSTVLASLMLNVRETLLVAIGHEVLLIVMGLLTPSWGVDGLLVQIFFHLFIPAFLLVSTVMRQQNLEQIHKLVGDLEVRVRETEAARAEAVRADKVKSAFLASMSHELRTPLNAVINFTKFVANGDLGPVTEQQKETLDEVIGSAKHLLNLINDVLDMSKIESGTLNLFVEENVNLQALIETVVSTGKGLLADKEVELEADIAGELPLIRADRQRILQILLNIMSNACKFTEEGKITLKARTNGSDVIVSIQDTGPGIAPEDQPMVFEAFKQTKTGLRQGGGTGLGMPISKNLAEAHGGRLWLESQPNNGATFFVSLPIKSDHLKPIFGAAEATK